MKNAPLLLKHSVILIGIMLVSVVTLVWYSVTHIMKYSAHEVAQSSLAETKANRELTEEVMRNIVENSARLASSKIFDSIRDIHSITDLHNNGANITNATSIQNELFGFNNINPGIHSSFFYLEDTDYVISTDKGITSLHNYGSINWLNAALEKAEGVKGVWFSRWEQADKESVISLVLPLHTPNTATKGTLVININETEFAHYLSSEQTGYDEYILINENGFIISHEDPALLFTNIKRDPLFSELVNDFKTDGYTYREKDGRRQLITWSRSTYTGWLNVNVYDVSKQMDTIYHMQNNIFTLALFMIIIGSLLSFIVTKKLSVPIQKLVAMVNGRIHSGAHSKNELALLEEAFHRMQDEEEKLKHLLNEREKDTKDIAVQHLIRGEVTEQVYKLFKKKHFIVAILAIDAYRKYSLRNSREVRSFHRYKWIAEIERLATEHTSMKCIYQGDGSYVLIINSDEAYVQGSNSLSAMLTMLQQTAAAIFQQSVTISVSNCSSSIHDIHAQHLDAAEGMKQRMLQGHGNIYYGADTPSYEQKNFYPDAGEQKVLSLIDQRDFDSIRGELANIREEISLQEGMSPDRVLFISHQLVGATIKHLREKNVNLQRLFASNKNIYTHLAMSETLDDVEEALVSFYEDIINHLLEPIEGEGSQYGDRIIQYLKNNYRQDIVFEEMAQEIGISYSYMRKIIIEITGMSLMDYVHSLRMKQAKHLLKSTQLTIAQIAEEVGYNNIRSFNRFFQKIENMTPSAYRMEQYKAINRSRPVIAE